VVQIPILSGNYTDTAGNVRTSYPINMIPVPKKSGISLGYLRPADGIVPFGTLGAAPGIDRGGIEWKGVCYRVMGSKLVSVDPNGAITILGDVENNNDRYVTFDYSFDRLAIASNGKLFYWNGSVLTQVIDPDLGNVVDVVWVDGYFMTTDGTSLVVTELTDPTQVNPLKYGSSELDPDNVLGLIKIRNEVYALNRHTIELFDNVGGEFFPFARIDGAQIMKGVIGTNACCVFNDILAFLGSGRNEAPGVYFGSNAKAQKISTQEIDQILLTYTEQQLSEVKMEAKNDKSHQHLYIHLPDRTIVFDAVATALLEEPVWFTLTSTLTDDFAEYRARSMVWVYDKWIVGDTQTNSLGYLTETVSSHWGDKIKWEFGTLIIYNESKGAIFHEMELVALTGRGVQGSDPQISTCYSVDGRSWSQEKFISAGKTGHINKRLIWFQQGTMRNWRIQKFKGTSDAKLSFLRLEASIEGLTV